MQYLQVPVFRYGLFLAFACSLHDATAQTAVKIWDKTYGLNGHNEYNAAIKTEKGGFLIGATWYGTPEAFKTRAFRGGKDFSLFRVDAKGKLLWNRNFGSLYDENLTALCQSADGGFLVGGIAGKTDYSYADTVRNVSHISENFRGKRDMWVIKLDGKGNKQWDRLYGGDQKEELAAFVNLPDGYLLVGSSESGVSGDKSEKNRGNYDYWVVRTDLKGKKLWDKTLGGSGFDKSQAAVVTADGGFLIGGNSNSAAGGDKTQDARTIKEGDFNAKSISAYKQSYSMGTDFWVVKLNAKGEKIWDRRYGGPGDDNLRDMEILPDGSVLLGGTTGSGPGGDKASGQRNGRNFAGDSKDYWLVKIAADGRQLWEKTYGGNYIDEFGDLLVTAEGQLLLSGFSSSGSNGDKSEDNQTSAVWLLKTDLNGNKLWDKQFVGLQNQYADRISLMDLGEGKYAFAALSNTGIFGDRSQPHKQMQANASWLVKVEEVVGTVIKTGKVLPAVCDAQTFEVPFTALGNFKPDNVFTAQLSDAKGKFGKPVTLGTLAGTGKPVNKIAATLPAGIAAGDKYRVRVVASGPETIGKDNGENFGIGKHTIRFDLGPSLQPEGGAPPYEMALDKGVFVKQYFNEQISNASPGVHTITVRDSRMCTLSKTFHKDPDQGLDASHTVNQTGTTMVWHKMPALSKRSRRNHKVVVNYKFEGEPAQVDVYLNYYRETSNKEDKAPNGKLTFDFPMDEDVKPECVVVVRDLKPKTTFTYSVKLIVAQD